MWAADDSRLDILKSQFESNAEPAVLAVSGGSDSTALMVLAARLSRARLPVVLTVDHRLRENSKQDSIHVAALAKKLGLEHHTLVWDHPPITSRIQEAARDARYQLIADWVTARGLTRVFVAHTMEDQAETFAMRLARASGPAGLAAMRPVSRWRNMTIVRPLLDFSRQELRDFLKQQDVKWVDDPANENTDFERIRARKALDQSRIEHTSARTLALAASRQHRADQALEMATDDFMRAAVTVYETGHGTVNRATFTTAPAEIAIRALARLIMWSGSPEIAPSLSRLEALYDRLMTEQTGQHTLKGAHIAARKDTIIVGREFGRMDPTPIKTKVWDNRFAFEKSTRIMPLGALERSPNWQRPKELPNFVVRTLPVIMTSKGNFAPHLEPEMQRKPRLATLPAGINASEISALSTL